MQTFEGYLRDGTIFWHKYTFVRHVNDNFIIGYFCGSNDPSSRSSENINTTFRALDPSDSQPVEKFCSAHFRHINLQETQTQFNHVDIADGSASGVACLLAPDSPMPGIVCSRSRSFPPC